MFNSPFGRLPTCRPATTLRGQPATCLRKQVGSVLALVVVQPVGAILNPSLQILDRGQSHSAQGGCIGAAAGHRPWVGRLPMGHTDDDARQLPASHGARTRQGSGGRRRVVHCFSQLGQRLPHLPALQAQTSKHIQARSVFCKGLSSHQHQPEAAGEVAAERAPCSVPHPAGVPVQQDWRHHPNAQDSAHLEPLLQHVLHHTGHICSSAVQGRVKLRLCLCHDFENLQASTPQGHRWGRGRRDQVNRVGAPAGPGTAEPCISRGPPLLSQN